MVQIARLRGAAERIFGLRLAEGEDVDSTILDDPEPAPRDTDHASPMTTLAHPCL